MIDVLPDQIEQLVARGFFKLRRVADFVDLRNFRPDQNARLVAQAVKIIAVLVMRAADDRRAEFLDERDVLVQVRLGNRPALVPAVLMPVHAVQGDTACRSGKIPCPDQPNKIAGPAAARPSPPRRSPERNSMTAL